MGSTRKSFMGRVREGERGVAFIFVAVTIVALFGISGFALDTANMMMLRRELQASTDAAALAAAQFLPDGAAAVSAANSYSAIAGGKNQRPSHPAVTMASGYPQHSCITKPGYPACGTGSNVIIVRQQSTMPTFFGRVVGQSSLTVRAHAAALMKGGAPKPHDVAIIMDTTASMNDSMNCGALGSMSKLSCAFAGFRSLLSGFWPCPDQVSGCSMSQAMDAVSVFTFPGLTNSAQQALEYDCSGSPDPAIATYSATTLYQVLGLQNDYKTSNTSTLSTSSNLVKAARGGASGCTQGIEAIGGKGTYYAGAINAAQAYLAANGSADRQNVIILLSDGDAQSDASDGQITSALEANQCAQAVSAAAAARAAGTWVYSIAYAAPPSGSCSKDSPATNACATMRSIASDPTKFYSTVQSGGSACTSAQNPQTDVLPIFERISLSLTNTRLVDE